MLVADDRLVNEIKEKYCNKKSNINLFVYKLLKHIVKICDRIVKARECVISIDNVVSKILHLGEKIVSINDDMSTTTKRTKNFITITRKYSPILVLYVDDLKGR